MHYSQNEKHEIIKLVEQSDLGVIRTLRELKVNKTTFYKWYNLYLENGYDGLARKPSQRSNTWNKINQEDSTHQSDHLFCGRQPQHCNPHFPWVRPRYRGQSKHAGQLRLGLGISHAPVQFSPRQTL